MDNLLPAGLRGRVILGKGMRMDRYDPYTDKFLRDTQYNIHGTNLAEVGTDCISRQAAMDALEQGFKDTTNGIDKLSPTYGLIKAITGIYKCYIGKLQPIKPKRGRWHYSDGKPARIGLSFGVVCDQCGTESEYCTNFCGECGADMRQREE